MGAVIEKFFFSCFKKYIKTFSMKKVKLWLTGERSHTGGWAVTWTRKTNSQFHVGSLRWSGMVRSSTFVVDVVASWRTALSPFRPHSWNWIVMKFTTNNNNKKVETTLNVKYVVLLLNKWRYRLMFLAPHSACTCELESGPFP